MKKLTIILTVLLVLSFCSFQAFAEENNIIDVSVGAGVVAHLNDFDMEVHQGVYNNSVSKYQAFWALEDVGITSNVAIRLFTELEFLNFIIIDGGIYLPTSDSYIGSEHFTSMLIDYNWVDANLGLRKEFNRFSIYGKGGINYSFNWNASISTDNSTKWLNHHSPGEFPTEVNGYFDVSPMVGWQALAGAQFKLTKTGKLRAYTEVGYMKINGRLDKLTVTATGNGFDDTVSMDFYNTEPFNPYADAKMSTSGLLIGVGFLYQLF